MQPVTLPRTSQVIPRKYERYSPVFWGQSIYVTDGVRRITCAVRDESLGGLGLTVGPMCGFQLYEAVTIQSGMLRRRAKFVYFSHGIDGAIIAGLAFLGDSDYS